MSDNKMRIRTLQQEITFPNGGKVVLTGEGDGLAQLERLIGQGIQGPTQFQFALEVITQLEDMLIDLDKVDELLELWAPHHIIKDATLKYRGAKEQALKLQKRK